ncbi:hypothetical protein FKZ61_021800 [Litorilinea aerophila]|uniref:Uncharacterized protein n=1 Tax=Litorilinea aerophila TaxID=1204385 RepID=A0A540V9F3_9CHLR|nr:hypothetical protein [Litorilinea aerophila]MCC9078734.1 hypothetical protein [Litorilinea aerophila]OUC05444.1 hypothetical protein RY27_27255 [Litorilinea aerophila]GIV78317.1 MAG: hypothetical protein KatS3mg050_2711 [Litorilinea sp.]
MNKPVNCRYFYGDYFRGKNKEECRLLAANPNNPYPWHRSLCNTCPVPKILIETNCPDLMLEAEVRRKFLRQRVEVTFAVCGKHLIELEDPRHCPQCARDQQGGSAS